MAVSLAKARPGLLFASLAKCGSPEGARVCKVLDPWLRIVLLRYFIDDILLIARTIVIKTRETTRA